MKYIITENRLDEFMTNYLNSWLEGKVVVRSSPFTVIEDKSHNDFDESGQYMEHDNIDGRLWIDRHFTKNLVDLFGKSEVDMKVFVAKWFGDKFDVDIEFVES